MTSSARVRYDVDMIRKHTRVLLRGLFALLAWAGTGARAAAPKVSTGVLADGTRWRTAYHVIDSGVDGPALLVVGGVHGNEPAGARAAGQVRDWPLVKGKLLVVPRANVPGLAANVRKLSGEAEGRDDLNRNFPSGDASDGPRGEPARAIWQFIRRQRPDWVLDLHEGFAFHGSHRPGKGKTRSVGSSVIFTKGPALDPIARAMQAAANATVTDPARRFSLLGGGPARGSLVGACTRQLGMRGMILETTYNHQPISLRTRQHRAMVSVLMRRLGMIDRDGTDVLARRGGGRIVVGLYDAAGTGGKGVVRLTGIVDAARDMEVHHVGPADLRAAALDAFDVLIFPGGSGSKQAAAIGPDGREAVRAFVRRGGGYLGICAGAFLCSAHYRWSLDLIDTHVFTGMRQIEGVGRKAMWYRGEGATVKMQLTDRGKALFEGIGEHVEVRYHNGPIVSPKNDPNLAPYTTLAHFRSEQVLYPPQKGTMVDTPAIVSGTYGKGRVISISPHPESSPALHPIFTASLRWLAAARQDRRASAGWRMCAATAAQASAGASP